MDQYLIHFTVEEFRNEIKKIVADTIRETYQEKETTSNPEYFSRKQTKEKLHVSYPTLNRFDKEGILKAHKIGGRVLYLSTEVDEAIKKNTSLKYIRTDRWHFNR